MGPPTNPGPRRGWSPPYSPFLGSVPGEGGEGGSPRAQGRSRFPQAGCPTQQQEFGWRKGTGSPVQPDPQDPHFSHHQLLLLSGTLLPPVLYTPTQIFPEPDGPPLSPRPILYFHPPPLSPLKDPGAQTPRHRFFWASCSRPGNPQGKPSSGPVSSGPGGVETLTTGRDRPVQGEGLEGDRGKEKIGHNPEGPGPGPGVPGKMDARRRGEVGRTEELW